MATVDPEHERRDVERQLAGEDVRDAARGLLDADGQEVLIELAEVDIAVGGKGSIDEHEPVELTSPGWLARLWAFATRTRVRRVVFFTLLAPLMLWAWIDSLGAGIGDVLERLVGGETCTGPRGSTARLIQHGFSALGPAATHLLVTDRNLVLARRALGGDRLHFDRVASVPRAEVTGASRAPRGLFRRRVRVDFADGSSVVLAVPSLRHPPSSPPRLVAALMGGGTG